MTTFDLWLKGCEVNETKLYCLEGFGDTGLYKTWTEYISGGSVYRTSPVFHVWIHGKREFASTDYRMTYKVYSSMISNK